MWRIICAGVRTAAARLVATLFEAAIDVGAAACELCPGADVGHVGRRLGGVGVGKRSEKSEDTESTAAQVSAPSFSPDPPALRALAAAVHAVDSGACTVRGACCLLFDALSAMVELGVAVAGGGVGAE